MDATMQHNELDAGVIIGRMRAERRVRQLEATLVAHNETTDRVVAACRAIEWRTPRRVKEDGHDRA